MRTLNSLLRRINLLPKSIKSRNALVSLFSSQNETLNHHSSLVVEYLTETFNLSKQRAQSVSRFYSYINSPEKFQPVLDYFQSLGFSQTDIRSSVCRAPEILFLDIDGTLKPKIELLQQLGLVDSHLCKFLSKNSRVLTVSLEKKLIPNIEILKKILDKGKNNEHLIRVITRNNRVVTMDPKGRLLSNIEYLESYGIVDSQLSFLLKDRPRLFTMEESKLRELLSRTLNFGFSVKSKMLVHGLHIVACLSEETLERKFQLFRSFGFPKDETVDIFRKAPRLLGYSEERLKLGLDLFLNKMVIKREVLYNNPMCLAYSVEGRVIPRYEVFQIVKSKRLLKKEPKFSSLLLMTEKRFLEQFVAKFGDDVEELLVAYKRHKLGSSSASSEGNVS